MAVLLARIRLPLQLAGFIGIGIGVVLVVVAELSGAGEGIGGWVILAGLAAAGVAYAAMVLGPPVRGEALPVASPVRGRWEAINSPTTKVPSHGTHGYGQTYAVDLVFAPHGIERPAFGRAGSSFLPPDRFPGFGQPLHAPADGIVVRATDSFRDHASRSSWAAYAWFFVESLPRELHGAKGVLGNHLVIRLADGTHFVFAHLKQGSLRVRAGDRVATGDVVAECGNTGNSTEPHLHCQRQDLAATFLAAGLPWTIEPGGIPPNGAALGEGESTAP